MLIYNLISYNIVCNTNKTTNANEIKALTRVESENYFQTQNLQSTDKVNKNKSFLFHSPTRMQ